MHSFCYILLRILMLQDHDCLQVDTGCENDELITLEVSGTLRLYIHSNNLVTGMTGGQVLTLVILPSRTFQNIS